MKFLDRFRNRHIARYRLDHALFLARIEASARRRATLPVINGLYKS